MKARLGEGDDLLQLVQSRVHSILPTLNPSGQNCIESDVQTLISSMIGFKSQLDRILTVNETCYSLWCQYDVERNAFTSWIESLSSQLDTQPQNETSLEDKKTALDNQQVGITFSFDICKLTCFYQHSHIWQLVHKIL